jgi:PKD repeat protein
MKRCNFNIKAIINLLVIIIILLPTYILAQDSVPKKIIYETDMCLDVDDAGGLAILHAMANNNEAEILAVCFNEVHRDGVAAIDAMNTWYGRGDIPVGIYRGNLSRPDGSDYLSYVAKFPHDLEDADAPSALDVYRQVLAAQPDSSVTIVSVGFLNNLNDLLIAEPELVAQKVIELVQMSGVNGDDFNLVRHNLSSASENVIENWPTPLVISQEGYNIYTGDNYQYAPEENPYREAFYRFFGGNFEGRPSWDEMAVLYGVRGLSTYFREITTGTGSFDGYVWDMEPGFRSYLENRLGRPSYEKIIEDLMDQLPLGAHFLSSESAGWLPFTVEFDASIANVGGHRSIEEYKWVFGDETTGEGEIVSHQYTSIGEFEVQLTVVDDLGDSLQSIEIIRVSDPIFSPIYYFGDITNYLQSQQDLWSTELDSTDLRLHLNNEPRNENLSMPGFSFLMDSIYSDFTLSITARTGEDISQNSLADYSIIFGYEDEDNYNYLLMKTSTARLVNISGGRSIDIGRTSHDVIPDEQYHEVVLNLVGEQLSVLLDDSVIYTANSARLLKEGNIGFGSTNSSVFFDDVEISGMGSPNGINFQMNLPEQFKLWQNYPNPFNPKTIINYEFPITNSVDLTIYDMLGQKVETLVSEKQAAGHHQVEWNAENLPSGVYYYMIKSGDFRDVKKMILLK